MAHRLASLAAALALVLALQPVAQAAAPGAHATKRAAAERALTKVKQLSQGKGVKTGRELTPAMAALAAALPSLSADDRLEAEAILARPDDTAPDPPDTHKWSPSAVQGPPYDTDHFRVHYVTNTADASNAAYAKKLGDILEDQVFPCENGTAAIACAGSPGLGWRLAAGDGSLGGNDKVDVYIEDLFTNEQVYGYVAVDPGQSQDPSVPHHAYMVLDNDYTRFGDDHSAAAGLAAEQVTAAHEYNHVLQNAYDYLEDSWMFEATAVWMEEKVYPDNNDYLRYVDDWVANTKQPLTTFSQTNLKAYGSAVWEHWLDHRFGSGAVRQAWESSVPAGDFAPGAFGGAIAALGGGSFSDEFDRFAAAVPEWNVPGAGFPDRYPDVGRDGTLPTGTQTFPFALPHTTFALFDVPIPPSAPPVIRLTGTLPQGTAGAIALVGRTGPDASAGQVTTSLTPLPAGGIGAVQLDNPGQFGRITAVVVNSDPSHGAFDAGLDDYLFTKDATDVVVSMAEPGAPIPTTGAAALISDHGGFVNATVDPHLNDTTWSIEYGRSSGYGSSTAPQALPGSTVGAVAVVAPLRDLRGNTLYHYRVVAENSAGRTVGRDQIFRTARDVTKPKISLRAKRQRLRTVRTRGVTYLLRCSEDCTGIAQLTLSPAAARKAGLPVLLGKTRVSLEARRTSKRLRLRPFASVRKKLATVRRSLRPTLTLKLADEARNKATAHVKVAVAR